MDGLSISVSPFMFALVDGSPAAVDMLFYPEVAPPTKAPL